MSIPVARGSKVSMERAVAGAIRAVGEETFALCLTPLFREALSRTEVTAWICANDATAFNALDFLRDRGVAVPERISVLGLDNVPTESLEKRLTTYDFNTTGFVHRLLNHILHPPRPRGPYRHRPIEVEGMIVERQTARVVR
jgi:DNA-binding LacI/PurR family transcriptional regulator